MTGHSKNIVVVLTKQYPYGLGETYLNNEIGVLSAQFDEVILAPTEAYTFEGLNPIVSEFRNVHVFQLNKKHQAFGFREKIKRQWIAARVLAEEIRNGREPEKHKASRKANLTYFKICYNQAYTLQSYLVSKGWADQSITLYGYWLHKATVLANVFKVYINGSVRSVSRAHSFDLYHKDWNEILMLKEPAFLPFEHFKIRFSDLVFPISEHGRKHFERYFPQLKDRFMVSRLGVVDRKKENPLHRHDFFRIVTCSGISPRKRLFVIPEILSHLKDLPIQWVHIGKGSEENVAVLQQKIEQYDVAPMIQIKGHMDNQAIHTYYQEEQVNLILNLSSAEGIPVSLMEAICYGIPGIVTDIVGNPEVIDQSCGYVVPLEGEANDIAKMIRLMYHDVELQMKLRKGARKMYEARYDALANYSQFAKTLRNLNSEIHV